MTDRETQLHRFLTEAGWADAAATPIAGDASTRAYRRLQRGSQRAVLMDAPPGAEDAACPPGASPQQRRALGYNAEARLAGPNLSAFTELSGLLRGAGLHAPANYAADPDHGFALIEDLGDGLYVRAIAAGADEGALYKAAVDALAHLHGTRLPRLAAERYTLLDYDETALVAEAGLLVDWYWKWLHGEPAPEAMRTDYRDLWRDMLSGLSAPHTLVLRDYHAENILWLGADTGTGTDNGTGSGARPAIEAVGLIDFQDALFGHAAYDLVSLLEDARRDVSPATEEAALDHYLEHRRAVTGDKFDEDAFHTDYALLAAQRNAKILGVFARLVLRDGKQRYAGFMPRVRGHFARDLARPALSPLRSWLATHMPELAAP